jgi:hypothetical protein
MNPWKYAGIAAAVCIAAFVITVIWPQVATPVNSALLVATLAAVVYYTAEAYRLRIQQRDEAEVREHPWLKVAGIEVVNTVHSDGVLGGVNISCNIENTGMTPANDVETTLTSIYTGEKVRTDTESHEDIHLAPGDEVSPTIVVGIDEPGEHELMVDVRYKTISGGFGQIEAKYAIDGPGKVRRLESHYDCGARADVPSSGAEV